MQTARIVQAVAIMMIVALAASCAASKEYTGKIFAPRDEQAKDSQAVALKFLDMDSLQTEKDGWVSTDIIMGRDTSGSTYALDNLAKIYPAKTQTPDSAISIKKEGEVLTTTDKNIKQPSQSVVVKSTPYGTLRDKKTRADKP